jgi:hypothetical protein
MSVPLIAVPKHATLGTGFSRRDIAESHVHPGRRTDGTQTAASWLSDLTDLRKLILLCAFCQSRFNPKRHRYRTWYSPDWSGATDPYQANGVCDGCKQRTYHGGRAYVAEETYRLVCLDPVSQRRASRWQALATSIGDAVARFRQQAWGSRSPQVGSA